MSKENNISEHISSKAMTISCLAGLGKTLEKQFNSNYKLILLTPLGIIKGSIIFEKKDNEEDYFELVSETKNPDGTKNCTFEVDISFALKVKKEKINDLKEEKPNLSVTEDGACFYVKNATLNPSSNPNINITFSQLIVFADQVIGVSLAPSD